MMTSHSVRPSPASSVHLNSSDVLEQLRSPIRPPDAAVQSKEVFRLLRRAEYELEYNCAHALSLQAELDSVNATRNMLEASIVQALSESFQADLDSVNTKRDTLEAYVTACRSIFEFASVHKLPIEILTTIFALCGTNTFRRLWGKDRRKSWERSLCSLYALGSIGLTTAFSAVGAAIVPFIAGAIAQGAWIWSLQPFMIGMLELQFLTWTCVPKKPRIRSHNETNSNPDTNRTQMTRMGF
ncbi:hypothetical protein D9758_001446 [Tetrapyrgos nigripes]|uniref:Uncharacterized protein n=1 Tax=Tetrapyrgos nigripes TaxID=182062 RepID=A0A8H5GXN0_9AGAR|nr:hypothetical protein D9758_001446 [Tetrapyrgos nigripes]